MIEWIYRVQTRLHQFLLEQIEVFRQGVTIELALVLLGACFLYGVFHAAGPGHGKLVLGSYALTSNVGVKRLVGLSLLSSMMQGLVAIVIIGLLVIVGGFLPRETETSVDWAERLSFLALCGIGLWLIIQAWQQWRTKGHGCNHHHAAVDTGIVASVALRPCTGAILVLVLCQSLGFFWLGAGSVLVMSAGTALGVALVTLAAIGGRSLLWKTAGHSRTLHLVLVLLRLLLGGFLLYIGWLLLMASFAPKHPLGL